jgi:uncharacterized protein
VPELPGEVRAALIQQVETSIGTARVHLSGSGPALLALGHGAGGGVDAVDLLAARDAALALGWRVALVEHPWRVKGRKVAEAPPRLDRAWVEVLAGLAAHPLVVGGRSAGARVACRTAAEVGATAVLCLAFPLHPPGKPDRTRLPELQAPTVPVLVVQGSKDPFGVPPGAELVDGAGHSFRPAHREQVTAIIRRWLPAVS